MIMKLFKLLLPFLLCVFFLSCSNDNEDDNSGIIICLVPDIFIPIQISNQTYEYNEDFELIKIIEGKVILREIEYDDKGRVSRLGYGSADPKKNKRSVFYNYFTKDKVLYNAVENDVIVGTGIVVLDGKRKVLSHEYNAANGVDEVSFATTYEYDKEERISKVKEVEGGINEIVYEYKYDDKSGFF